MNEMGNSNGSLSQPEIVVEAVLLASKVARMIPNNTSLLPRGYRVVRSDDKGRPLRYPHLTLARPDGNHICFRMHKLTVDVARRFFADVKQGFIAQVFSLL